MAKTYLDELIEIPAKALQKIGTNQKICSLLTDNQNLDMSSDEADDVFDKYLFDYGYIDTTASEASAYICAEAELNGVQTHTVQDYCLYITVVCHKNFMKLDPKKFTGMTGNRRDNIVRNVDELLSSSDIAGIGYLVLESVRTRTSAVGFTARELTYRIYDFKNKGQVGL